MLEILAKLSAPMKLSILPIFLLTAFHRSEKKTDVKIKRNDFGNDQVPGDNFPFVVMKDYQIHPMR